VVVAIKDAAGEEVQSPSTLDKEGADVFGATIPFIQSVDRRNDPKTNSGSILGGDTLKIKGAVVQRAGGSKPSRSSSIAAKDVVKTVPVKIVEGGEMRRMRRRRKAAKAKAQGPSSTRN